MTKMTAVHAARTRRILDTTQRFGSFGIMTRRAFIEARVAEGWEVIHVPGGKSPERFAEDGDEWGWFFTPAGITQTAFSYAMELKVEKKT